MGWLDHHREGESLAATADRLIREGDHRGARVYIARAAQSERQALHHVHQDEVRTRGVLALRATLLSMKAGEFEASIEVANGALAEPYLPLELRQQLYELVRAAIQCQGTA